jgi:hypothetical protein
MEADAIDDAIQVLQADYAALAAKHDKLRTDYDLLSLKLRYPGTKFLVDLGYRLVYDATITCAAGGPHSTLIQTRKDLQHAVYVLSARRTDTNGEGVLYNGMATVLPGNSVQLAIESRYNSSGPSLDTYLLDYNSKATSVSVAVKIWQRLGLG